MPDARPTPDHVGAIHDLRTRLRGDVVLPGADSYDRSRALFYGGFDRRPAVVARPRDAADVAAVVTTAVEHGLDLSVRSGGHGILGHAVVDDALLVDLSGIRHLDIDLEARTARVGPGLTTGEYTRTVGRHGLATGFGDAGSVGIGGITLGGGVGLLSRLHGLTIDQVLAAELVTATGEVVQVDHEHHPDLFWALRGGGGNFGIVTEFTLRLEPVPTVLGGELVVEPTPDVLAGIVKAAHDAPDEVSTIVTVMAPAPPAPFVPPEVHGKRVLMLQVVHAGGGEVAERALAPFRDLASPVLDTIEHKTYPEMFPDEEPEAGPDGSVANVFLDDLTIDDAELALDRLDASPAPVAVLQLRVLGGAVARHANDATAYPHRDRRIMATVAAMVPPGGEADGIRPWLDDVTAALGGTGGYVNFVGDASPTSARAAFGDNWDRLVAVKRRWDPDNVFHHNVNIPPG